MYIVQISLVTCATLLLIFILRADANWLIITLAILGRWGVTATWNFLYMITSEVYPTPLRSIGLASCSMVGRIGGVVSPFISQLVCPQTYIHVYHEIRIEFGDFYKSMRCFHTIM